MEIGTIMGLRDNSILTVNLHNERIQSAERVEWLIRSQKYKMFFAGLIFAIISFIGVNPVKTSLLWLKILEVISSVNLLFAGIFLLLRLSEISFRSNERVCKLIKWSGGIIFNSNLSYWILFLIGMSLLVFDRAVLLFHQGSNIA